MFTKCCSSLDAAGGKLRIIFFCEEKIVQNYFLLQENISENNSAASSFCGSVLLWIMYIHISLLSVFLLLFVWRFAIKCRRREVFVCTTAAGKFAKVSLLLDLLCKMTALLVLRTTAEGDFEKGLGCPQLECVAECCSVLQSVEVCCRVF